MCFLMYLFRLFIKLHTSCCLMAEMHDVTTFLYEIKKIHQEFYYYLLPGTIFKAHKLILAACSKNFADLFETPSLATGSVCVILEATSAENMAALLEFMYKGEVHVSQKALESFLKAAESLQVCQKEVLKPSMLSYSVFSIRLKVWQLNMVVVRQIQPFHMRVHPSSCHHADSEIVSQISIQ